MKHINLFLIVLLTVLIFSACKEEEKKVLTPEEKEYAETLQHIRKQTNRWMKDNPDSPFNKKEKVEFHPLNYFEPNMDFIFKSKLHQYQAKDTVTVFGTKGEKRTFLRFGYFIINYDNEMYHLNVYQGVADGKPTLSVWFTDETTGDETYGVGRYINVRWNKDPEFVYTIDFNAAYNPYCAYSKEYSCAIPRKEDHLDFAVEAGEKIFHD